LSACLTGQNKRNRTPRDIPIAAFAPLWDKICEHFVKSDKIQTKGLLQSDALCYTGFVEIYLTDFLSNEVIGMSNKIKLNVGGIDYYISSEDEEAYVRSVGDELNRRLDQIARQNPYLSTAMVAVFAALEYCDESKKAAQALEDCKMQIKGYVEESACAKLEADEARREIERLGKENYNLRMQLEAAQTAGGTTAVSPLK
jgi:cell division protein ZapA